VAGRSKILSNLYSRAAVRFSGSYNYSAQLVFGEMKEGMSG